MASNSPLIFSILVCNEWLRCATGLHLHWIWTSLSLLFTQTNLVSLSKKTTLGLVTRESIKLFLKKQVGFSYLLMARFPLHDLVKRSFRYAHCSLVIYLACLPLTRYISFKNARSWLVILLIHT